MVLPGRRVIDRTIGWIGRSPRLARDYEGPSGSVCGERRTADEDGGPPTRLKAPRSLTATTPLGGFQQIAGPLRRQFLPL
jgi:hypothetical protein